MQICRVPRERFDLSLPDMSDIEPVEVGPWNPFETTYSLHYSTGSGMIFFKNISHNLLHNTLLL